MQSGDKEKSDRILDVILGGSGVNLAGVLGSTKNQAAQPIPQNTNPNLAGLLPQTQ